MMQVSITFFQYSLYSLFLLALRDSTHLNSFMFRQRVTLAINQVQVVGPENTNFSPVMLQLQSHTMSELALMIKKISKSFDHSYFFFMH